MNLPYRDAVSRGLWQALFAYCAQNYPDTAEFLVNDRSMQEQMIRITNYIFENYQTVTLAETARHFHFNEAYLSTRIHQATGSTFTTLLKNCKLQRAAELLISTGHSIEQVCRMVGYDNVPQFIRTFKKHFGQTPGQYRTAHAVRT